MPNGHLDIGVGQGDAYVQNNQPAIQAITNILAQNKAKRDAEKQAIINQIGSLKTDGLRDADRNDYYNAYNDWKNTAIQANNAKSGSRDKMDLQGMAMQKYNQLNDFVNRSKVAGQDYHQKANMFLQDNFRHQFKDDAVNNFLGIKDLPMSDDRFKQYSDVNNLQRQVNHDKVDQVIEKAKDQALEPIVAQLFQSKGTRGDRTGTWVDQKKIIPFDGENGVYHRLLNATTTSPDFRKSLDDRYGNIEGQTPEETNALRVQQYAKDKGWDKGWVKPVGSSQFQAVDDSFAKHIRNRMFDIAHPIRKEGEGKTADPTYFQDLSERMRTGVKGSGEEFNNQLANNPAYLHGLTINKDNPKAVEITIPAKYHQIKNPNADQEGQPQYVRAVEVPSYKVTLDSTDPTQWHAGFARIYRDITGDATAAPSKALTQSGKGKVPGGLKNPEQDPQATNRMVTFSINGKTGQIPADQVAAFKKKYPNAVRQ